MPPSSNVRLQYSQQNLLLELLLLWQARLFDNYRECSTLVSQAFQDHPTVPFRYFQLVVFETVGHLPLTTMVTCFEPVFDSLVGIDFPPRYLHWSYRLARLTTVCRRITAHCRYGRELVVTIGEVLK